MALNLKRGPKAQIWVPIVIHHRDDDGKTFTDEFEALIRTPSNTDDLIAEAAALQAASDNDAGGRDRNIGYIRNNLLGWRKLLAADNTEIPFTPENLEELAKLATYQVGLVRNILATRQSPEGPERKN